MTFQQKQGQHAEWLSLVEVSGPFLAEPVLKEAFPQGLETVDPVTKKRFKQTYEEWRDTVDSLDETPEVKEKIHREWINWVLKIGLEWDEDDEGEELKTEESIPNDIELVLPEHGITLKPDYALYQDQTEPPYILVKVYPSETKLEEVTKGDNWATTPAERMAQLCRSVGTRLGLVTNGEQWLFIDAPKAGVTTYASWFARLWSQEPVTLRAFYSLLNIGTMFNGFDGSQKLPELLDESLKHQDEVTEALGEQVSRAVEVLIQSLDRINHDHNGKLLEGVEPQELYEAGLTLMMRLVFLLCAEERGFLLLGDDTYEANYAVTTLRQKLREEATTYGEEVLSFRKNAWSRLLSVFRAVYGGIEHENLRMPALGGSLFDPDRFPFLEGRAKGTSWKVEEATPLPIDNRTVLLFLDAIQIYKGRALSYRALDVEQIGYVYEGLLEKTVVRAKDVTLELNANSGTKKPWAELKELASAALDGSDAVIELIAERTKKQRSSIKKQLSKELSDSQQDLLLSACHNDISLRDRLKPYFHFLRLDAWENPLIYPKGSFMVITGMDRRDTGTHYTPKFLTESIVKETLEPVAYKGPAEGKPREEWRLKSSEELLALKICDPAMGSGAFLVQVCRWLADRVSEAWLLEQQAGKYINAEGEVCIEPGNDLLSSIHEEKIITARRLIAERCLYGVDINPLAVELAKLSIWLVTFSKGRPFGFLDHNFKSGDSLLGLTELDQLYLLDMNPSKLRKADGCEKHIYSHHIESAIREAVNARLALRNTAIRDIHDVEVMKHLDGEIESQLFLTSLAADSVIAEVLSNEGSIPDKGALGVSLGEIFVDDSFENVEGITKSKLTIDLTSTKQQRKPFHWCLEFAEVFDEGGFDAVVGNPPFVGGSKITGALGRAYREHLVANLGNDERGLADLVAFFFLLSFQIVKEKATIGLISVNTIAEGDTRKVGLQSIIDRGGQIYKCFPDEVWPGKAAVVTSRVHIYKGKWHGEFQINSEGVDEINSYLSPGVSWVPKKLQANVGKAFNGSCLLGDGFLINQDEIREFNISEEIVFPFLNGRDLNSSPNQTPSRWVLNFWDWNQAKASVFGEAYKRLEILVKPYRSNQKTKSLREKWWIYKRPTIDLYKAIGTYPGAETPKMNRVLVLSRTSKTLAFSFVESDIVFSDATVVFAIDDYFNFGVLQSNIHAVFAWQYSSKLKSDLRYSLSDCFETFPFPNLTSQDTIEIAKELYSCRKLFMLKNDIGLTDFYNQFHDKENFDDDLNTIRDLQVKLDNSVIDLYGWSEVKLGHDFHKVAYLPDNSNTRFTISEQARGEVLFRLANLNKERSEEEEMPAKGKVMSERLVMNNGQESLF